MFLMYSVSSIIEKNAEIGQRTNIWYFSHVCEYAKIGEDCNIGEKSYIGSNVIIGNNVKVGNNVNIYDGAVIHDDVFIGNGVCFTNVRKPVANQKGKKLHTIIEKEVSIGANCVIVGGITIGKGAIIADGSVVVGNVPAGVWVNGNPGKIKIR